MKEKRLYMIFTYCKMPKIKEVINNGLAKVFASVRTFLSHPFCNRSMSVRNE